MLKDNLNLISHMTHLKNGPIKFYNLSSGNYYFKIQEVFNMTEDIYPLFGWDDPVPNEFKEIFSKCAK